MILRNVFRESGFDAPSSISSPEIKRAHKEKIEPRDFSETEITTMLGDLRTLVFSRTPWCEHVADTDAAWEGEVLLPEYKAQLDEFLGSIKDTALLDMNVYKQLCGGDKTRRHVFHDLSGVATLLLSFIGLCKEGRSLRQSLKIVAKKLPIYLFILEDVLLRSVNDEKVSPDYERSVVPPEILDTSIGNVMEDLSLKFPKKELDITGNIARLLEENEEIRTVPGVFMNGIINCVQNAVKMAIEAEHIHVHILRRDTAILIHIIDDGKGMEAEQINPRVPERFIFNKVSETSSTGLGLHFVDTRIQSLGGAIQVATRPRGKSDFDVYSSETGTVEHVSDAVAAERFRGLQRATHANTVFEFALPITQKNA